MSAEKPLPGTSPKYDNIEGVVRAVIFDVALDEVLSKIIAAVPFLGWPVFRQVFTFIVTKLLSVLYGQIEEAIALAVIDARVQAERKAYTDAMAKLREEIQKPAEENNADEIAKAKQLAKDKLRALIRYRP